MTLAIWNAIWTPLTIAFDRASQLGEQPIFTAIDYFVDTVFVLDIIFQFMSSYHDKASGREIF